MGYSPDQKRDFQYYQAFPPATLPKGPAILAHLRPWTFSQIFTYRDYIGILQSQGRNDAAGIMATNGSTWRRKDGNPYWPEPDFSSRDGWKLPDIEQAVQLVKARNGHVETRFYLCGGYRVTGIAVYDKRRDYGRYVIEDIRQKTSETPLSDLLEMVLDWPEKTSRPHLYGSREVFDKARVRYDPKKLVWKATCPEFKAMMTNELSGSEEMRNAILKAARRLAEYYTPPAPFTPAEPEKPRVRKGYVGTGLRSIEVGPLARNLAGRYDLASALGILSNDDKRFVRSVLAFLAYKFSDPEFFAPLCALGNFKIDGYFALAVIALTLPDYPHAKTWLDHAWRQIAEDLDQGYYIYESGAGNECEIYRAMSLNFLTQLAMLLRVHGDSRLASHPRLAAALNWFIEFSVPPVPSLSYGLSRASLLLTGILP